MLPHLIWEQSTTYSLAAICIHTCGFLEKAIGTFAFANCVKPRKGFGEETHSRCGQGLPQTPFEFHTMHDLADEAIVQGYEAQNKYYSVKWNWTGGIASEPNTQSTVGSTLVSEMGILYSGVQLLRKVLGAQWQCLLDLPEKRCRVSAPHKHSGSLRSHCFKHFL